MVQMEIIVLFKMTLISIKVGGVTRKIKWSVDKPTRIKECTQRYCKIRYLEYRTPI